MSVGSTSTTSASSGLVSSAPADNKTTTVAGSDGVRVAVPAAKAVIGEVVVLRGVFVGTIAVVSIATLKGVGVVVVGRASLAAGAEAVVGTKEGVVVGIITNALVVMVGVEGAFSMGTGASVGFIVGDAVGFVEGCEVGFVVGNIVGCIVGCEVDFSVGDAVGVIVGVVVSMQIGEGEMVGAGVESQLL